MASTERELPKPEWAALDDPTAFNIQPGSIGHRLLAKYNYLLGGRLRPVTIFDQRPRPISLHSQGLTWIEAGKRGLSFVGEVLRLPEDTLTPPTFSARFVEGLHDYVQGLAVPPHAQLVNVVFNQEHPFTPFPSALEQEFIQTVEEQIDRLAPREREILVLRHGLYDGIHRTLDKTAAAFNVTREYIRQLEVKALRKLRHPSRAKYLEMFMPFPEGSLGRAVFGPRLRRYLPPGVSVQPLLAELEQEVTPFELGNIHRIAVWLDYGLDNQQAPVPF